MHDWNCDLYNIYLISLSEILVALFRERRISNSIFYLSIIEIVECLSIHCLSPSLSSPVSSSLYHIPYLSLASFLSNIHLLSSQCVCAIFLSHPTSPLLPSFPPIPSLSPSLPPSLSYSLPPSLSPSPFLPPSLHPAPLIMSVFIFLFLFSSLSARTFCMI